MKCAAQRLAAMMRTGSCPNDQSFDRFLPEPLRLVSSQYWTPLAVVKRAADWLEDVGIRTVVDIGSGAGKFCAAGALFSRCRFIGLEQYSSLVRSAVALVDLFGLSDRVSFVAGDLRAVTAPVGDAYYFFNPFGEYWLGADYPTEADGDVIGMRWAADIAAAEDLLRSVPEGTWILTHNGFGGRMPAGYELVRVDGKLAGVLRLWRKRVNTARIGSPRMLKNGSGAGLALASRPARAHESSGRQVSGCRAERRETAAQHTKSQRFDQ
jgi:SAM-dependent methyltransferase